MSESKGMKEQTAAAMQTMQDVMEAMVRFSSAMAMFGVQQLKNTADMAMDPQNGPVKFQKTLNQMTNLMEGALDEGNKATSQKLASAGEELIASVKIPAFDPTEVTQTVIESFRSAMDSMTDLVKKTASSVAEAAKEQAEGVTAGAASAGESKAAA